MSLKPDCKNVIRLQYDLSCLVLFGPVWSLSLGPGPLSYLFGRSYTKVLSLGRSSVGPQPSDRIRSRSRASEKMRKTGTETDPGLTETGTVHHWSREILSD